MECINRAGPVEWELSREMLMCSDIHARHYVQLCKQNMRGNMFFRHACSRTGEQHVPQLSCFLSVPTNCPVDVRFENGVEGSTVRVMEF